MKPSKCSLIFVFEILFCHLIDLNAQQPTISTISVIQPASCNNTQYYDISHLECKPCPPNSSQSNCKKLFFNIFKMICLQLLNRFPISQTIIVAANKTFISPRIVVVALSVVKNVQKTSYNHQMATTVSTVTKHVRNAPRMGATEAI